MNIIEVNVYYKPEETNVGRLDHHGKNEVFRTELQESFDVSKIERKVSILKLREYFLKEFEDIDFVFVCRQFYDSQEKNFKPELIELCFCNKVISPDDDLVKCSCDYFYHYDCTRNETLFCIQCQQLLKDELYIGETLKRKRFLKGDEIIKLKKQEGGFNLLPRNQPVQQKHDVKTFKNSAHSQQQQFEKQIFQKRKIYQNLSDENYDKLNLIIERYKQSYPIKFVQGIDKDRYSGRENLFINLIYGIQEIRQYYDDQERLQNQEIKNIVNMNDTEQYELARRLSIEIEASIYAFYNQNQRTKIEQAYRSRFRVILANLRDEKNEELRYKILSGEINPKILSQIDETELANSESKRIREEREQRYIKEHTLDNKPTIIVTKSHKGDIFLDINDKIYEKIDYLNNQINDDTKIKKESTDNNDLSNKYEDEKLDQVDSFQEELSKQKSQILESKQIDSNLDQQLLNLLSEKHSNKFIDRIKQHLPIQDQDEFVLHYKNL